MTLSIDDFGRFETYSKRNLLQVRGKLSKTWILIEMANYPNEILSLVWKRQDFTVTCIPCLLFDFRPGSQQIGLDLTPDEIATMISSGDFDKDKAINYYEFLVRFGLEHQNPGKWIFQVRLIVEAKQVIVIVSYC